MINCLFQISSIAFTISLGMFLMFYFGTGNIKPFAVLLVCTSVSLGMTSSIKLNRGDFD